MNMKLSTAFRRGAALIAEPGKWQQGAYGYHSPEDDDGCYCMLGAAGRAAERDPDALVRPQGVRLGDDVVGFNDDPDTTQEDAVMASLVLAEFLRAEGL